MKILQKNKKTYSLVSILLGIALSAPTGTSVGTTAENLQYQTIALQSKKGLLAEWFKSTSNKFSPAIEAAASSNEIWGRVRQRFHITAPTSAPLYQRHIKRYAKSQSYINELVRNASPYLYYILEEVEKRGMPSEIALLPMIESEFNPHTISHKGAVGLWQLMPTLGRIYGLKQNAWVDDRKDIYESTKVALDHLEYLHKKFNGNWLLALAAYNSGEARVLNAIKKNKSAQKATDFWSLNLPQETMHYVPKLLALVAIIKSPKEYGVVLPNIANQPVFARINTGKPIDITHAAKLVDVSETQLRKLNPSLHKKAMHPNGPFNLVVPINQAAGFKQQIAATPAKALTKTASNASLTSSSDVKIVAKTTSAKATYHIVQKGDSIPKISEKYNIATKTFMKNNNFPKINTVIHPGQRVLISTQE